MELTKQTDDGIGIVSLSGRLDASNADKNKLLFQKMMNQTIQFVFDLSNLEFVDSTGLGALVGCLKLSLDAGGTIKLCCVQAKPKMVFEVTRAHTLFDIYDTLDQAVKSFSQ